MSVDVLAVGPHPDDVEIGCGGTLARLVDRGLGVGILHLTTGEAGTRGSAELRREEALAAGAALGVSWVRFLDCGDGGLRTGTAEEDAIIEVLRSETPRLVFAPPEADRHPDHGRAHALVVAAAFYAGLDKRSPELGPSHRPDAVFSYMLHDSFEPSFLVDVGAVWERKSAALDAYRSQLRPSRGAAEEGPTTKVASRDFRASVEGRARHYGLLISASHAEPFRTRTPPAADPWDLLPPGPA